MYKKINFYQHIRMTSGAASRWLCTRFFFQEIYWHIMVLFFEFLITIFKILAIVIIALPISGLLFPKNPTWKLSNFLKFLFFFGPAKIKHTHTRHIEKKYFKHKGNRKNRSIKQARLNSSYLIFWLGDLILL